MSSLYAQSSGHGRAGVAIFRLTGPLAGPALVSLTGSLGQPRLARRAMVRDAEGHLIDDGLALWFPGPHSFTGEDVAELQLHGSPAVALCLAEELERLGFEAAGPGAFTLRAFENGKMDLTQAEGLGDLLQAETKLQHEQAMNQFRGALRGQAEAWRRQLIEAMAMLDAAIDFPDEDGVPEEIAARSQPVVDAVQQSLHQAVTQAPKAGRLKSGISVAIIGPPNAGKSSLFNALLKEERAIVSPEAGTTRDVVTARVDWEGFLVDVHDTAGIRARPASAIEADGIDRAERVARDADIRLVCWPLPWGVLPSWLKDHVRDGDVVVRTLADQSQQCDPVAVSTISQQGMSDLRALLTSAFRGLAVVGLTPSARQQELVEAAYVALSAFSEQIRIGPEAAAETLRMAAQRLESLTGRIAPDDVLADIFSSFCIGK